MPRKGPAVRREIPVDPIYKSVLVTQGHQQRFLERGKRTIAERIVYTALELVEQKTTGDPVATLKRALENNSPRARSEIAAAWVGLLPKCRSRCVLAVRRHWRFAGWTDLCEKKRREKTMADRLANEIIDASNGVGAAVKRREDVAKMAESNKAFAPLPLVSKESL